MEIKEKLNKPYTEKERLDFVCKYQVGFELKETDSALEAWGKTEEEQAEDIKNARKAELLAQLEELDLKTIRPLRAIQANDFSDEDVERLQELEEQATQIRAELQNL